MVDFKKEEEEFNAVEKVGRFVGRGLPAAIVSAGTGFINTGVAVTNAFGSDIQRVNTGDAVEGILGDDTGQYYDDHSSAIDTIGFVAGSIVPGMAAVRGVRGAQAAFRTSGKLRTGVAKALVPESGIKALTKTIKERGIIDAVTDLKGNKIRAIAAGFHQQALEAAAFEGAVLLTMNQNPAITKDDLSYMEGITSNLDNAAFGLVFGGAFGGIFDAVANVGKANKLVKREWLKNAGDFKVLTEGVRQGLVTGDVLLAPAETLLKSRLALQELNLLPKEKVAGRISDVTKQNLAAQEGTETAVAKLTDGDADLSAQLMDTIINSERVDDIADIFSGTKSIRSFEEKDLLMEPPTSITAHVFDVVEAVDFQLGIFKANNQTEMMSGGKLVTITRQVLAEELKRTNGAMFPAGKFGWQEMSKVEHFFGATGFAQTAKKNDWENIFTWRHETGHGILNEPASAFSKKSLLGKRLIEQATTLSRIARPANWRGVDRAKLRLAAGDTKFTTSEGKVIDLTAMLEKDISYMENTRELFADTYAVISDAQRLIDEGIDVQKDFPDVYKFMVANRGMARELGQSRSIYNLQTREIFEQFSTPTAADLGKESMSVVGGVVTFGVKQSVKLDTNYGEAVLRMNWDEASALMSASHVREDIMEGITVDWLDIPRLTAIKAQGIKSFKVRKDGITISTVDSSNALTGFESGAVDEILVAAKVQVGQSLRLKSRKIQQIARNNDIPLDEVDELLSDNQIARMIDADAKFMERIEEIGRLNTKQALDGGDDAARFLDDYTDTPFWSAREGLDPMKKTFAVLQPDRRAVIAGKRAAGLADAESRVKVDREMYDNISAMWFGDDFAALSKSAHASDISFADNISGGESTSSFVGSANADPLSGQTLPQYIGRTLDRAVRKKITQISNMFDNDIVRLADDEAAVYEANVLDSILRQRAVGNEFEFLPTGSGVNGLNEFITNTNLESALQPDAVARLASTGVVDEIFVAGNSIWSGSLRKNIVKTLTRPMDDMQLEEVVEAIRGTLAKEIHEIKSEGLAGFWRKMVQYNADEVVSHKNNMAAAIGGRANLNPRALYPGVPDTRKFPYHALVVRKKNGVMTEQSIGMVTGHDADSLAKNIRTVQKAQGDNVEVVTERQIERYKKIRGEYESEKLYKDTVMDSSMKRRGTAWDVVPQADPQIFNQYKAAMESQQATIGRNMVELKYSEEIGGLKQYADYFDTYNSAYGNKKFTRNVFRDVENMMLNKRPDNFQSVWNQVNTITEAKISEAFHTVKGAAVKAQQTDDWEKMAEVMERYGMDKMYDESNKMLLNKLDAPVPVVKKLISKINFAIGTSMLRMDFAHALTNVVSLPVMATSELGHIRRVVSADTWQVLRDGTSVKIPGTDKLLPTNMAMANQAVKNHFKRPELIALYREKGIINSTLEDIASAQGDFAKIAGETSADTIDGLATNLINKISAPSDYSEQFVKFVAADMANQFLTAAKVADDVKWSAINNFVTRVHGNYLSSQRPTLFQGWMGQTVGLFQTYQFNLMQSLFGNVAAGNKGAVAKMVGMQAGIFGAQGVPGFQLLNEYIGERSDENNDFYRATGEMFGDDLANFFLYGAASSAAVPIVGDGLDLYARGDLTPRTPILIPTSPMEVPMVSIVSNFMGAVGNAFNKMENGAPAYETALDAMAHNGFNRPLQGLFQLMAGERTTNNGRLISTYQGFDMWNVATKLMGTKKLSEAVATSSFYRTAAYSSYRQTELNDLGSAYRQTVRAGKNDQGTYLKFMRDYSAKGGNIEQFGGWVNRNTDGANESIINKLRANNNSPEGRYLQEVMGGKLEDYTTDFSGQ